MSKTAPWVKFFASDFLTGIADLDADEIGAYTVILALIWDRGAPIADDPAWIARRAGTSTRRFNQIRAKLLQLGKLEARNGLLGNRRAIEEVQARDRKSDQARSAAFARWAQAQEPELPLADQEPPAEDYLAKKRGKKREKTQEQIDLETNKSEHNPQKSAIPGDADASFPSRAPAYQRLETRVITDEQGNETREISADPEPPRSPLDDRDLVGLMQACTEAAGFNPTSPVVISRELDIIRQWRADGLDFEHVVIPTINAIIARTSDPTSSLKRFDRQVRLEQTKSAQKPRPGSAAYRAPASPIMHKPEEPEIAQAIRADLLALLGPEAFCHLINPISLEPVEDAGGGRNPIRVRDPRPTSMRTMNGPTASRIRQVVQKHGFSDAWEA